MNETNDTISKYLKDLENKTFSIHDVKHKDPLTNEEIFTFDNMFIEDNNSALTFIYGENSSGKSFIARCFEIVAASRTPSKLPVRSMSVANRTSSGVEKAMIYGNESSQSTGETSFSVLKLAVRSLKEEPSVLIMDEPDIGLSSKYSRSLGRYIAELLLEKEKHGQAFIIISHNDAFLESIKKHYGKPYNSVGVNTQSTLQEWLDDDSEFSIEDLEQLPEIALAKWRGIAKIFGA